MDEGLLNRFVLRYDFRNLSDEAKSCIVQQIRNILKHVASKDQKAFLSDLKLVYRASTKELAEQQVEALDQKWSKKYPLVIHSWRNNWAKLIQKNGYHHCRIGA